MHVPVSMRLEVERFFENIGHPVKVTVKEIPEEFCGNRLDKMLYVIYKTAEDNELNPCDILFTYLKIYCRKHRKDVEKILEKFKCRMHRDRMLELIKSLH